MFQKMHLHFLQCSKKKKELFYGNLWPEKLYFSQYQHQAHKSAMLLYIIKPFNNFGLCQQLIVIHLFEFPQKECQNLRSCYIKQNVRIALKEYIYIYIFIVIFLFENKVREVNVKVKIQF